MRNCEYSYVQRPKRLTLKPTLCYTSFFDRDVQCIRRFFRRRFRLETEDYPTFRSTLSDLADERSGKSEPESGLESGLDTDYEDGILVWSEERRMKARMARRGEVRLDEMVEASGFGKDMWKDLEMVSRIVRSLD